jgi:hypothetical protein
MLLVTFHGGKGNIVNVYTYATSGSSAGTLLTDAALSPAPPDDSELRGMLIANDCLYVCNSKKSVSDVTLYSGPSSDGSFTIVATLIAATFSSKKDKFKTSISHPFGIVFGGTSSDLLCYVSNQDTNVVAQVAVTANGHSGSLGTGSQSQYLTNQFPKGAFLDGTFVASEKGKLPDVDITATDVPSKDGGLKVTFDKDGNVHNSVRDVAIANGILFVCDEPHEAINMYSLTDGTFLGASNTLSDKPTHLSVHNGGLWVSAGGLLYWAPAPAYSSSPTLNLGTLTLSPAVPSNETIGGISFDSANSSATLYIPFQTGTGGSKPGGSIYTYAVTQSSASSAPVVSSGALFGPTSLSDTPEFVLYVADPS